MVVNVTKDFDLDRKVGRTREHQLEVAPARASSDITDRGDSEPLSRTIVQPELGALSRMDHRSIHA